METNVLRFDEKKNKISQSLELGKLVFFDEKVSRKSKNSSGQGQQGGECLCYLILCFHQGYYNHFSWKTMFPETRRVRFSADFT